MVKTKIDNRAQAALTDSLFFLAIVAAITAMLFFYMTSYGNNMNTQLDAFYTKDFAADSLKVITYVNVLRDGTELQKHIDGDYAPDAPQFDYLLTLMKEDYSDTQKFSPETVSAIALTLNSVLQPFSSVDYSFYLLSESENEFLFLMLSVHTGTLTIDDPDNKKYDFSNVQRVFYSCEPINQDVLSKHINSYVGQIDQSKGKISFLDPDVTDSLGRPFIIGLDVWISKDLPVIRDLEAKTTPAGQDFSCSVIMRCDDGREDCVFT